MLKILRITSIIVAVAGSAIIVFGGLSKSNSDEKAQQVLASDGIVQRFKKGFGASKDKTAGQTPPLVVQAGKFALYLDPPKPKQELPAKIDDIKRPPSVTFQPKFKLIGTSFYAQNPEMSLAFIDEPGKGMYWIRPAEVVGHLLIEQINDGFIVVRDGDKSMKIMVGSEAADQVIPSQDQQTSEPVPTSVVEPQPISMEEKNQMDKFLNEMKTLDGKLDNSAKTDEEKEKLMKKLIEQLKSVKQDEADSNINGQASPLHEPMRITSEEAEKLSGLKQEQDQKSHHDDEQAQQKAERSKRISRIRKKPNK